MQFTRWCGVIVVSGLVACSGRSATYVEPQVPPHVGTALVHSPADPTVVLITEYAGALSLWRFADLRTPERLATVFTDAHLATFSADGKTIVVFGKDGKLRILDFKGKAIAESAETARGGTLPAGIAVDPDGQRVVTVGRDGVWSWSLPKLDRTSIEPNVHASAAAFSTRGALAIGYASGLIKVSTKPNDITLAGHGEEIRSLEFLRSGDKLIAASSRSARLWDLQKPQEGTILAQAGGGDQSMTQVLVDPSTGYFAAVYDDDEDDEEEGALWLWNPVGVHVATQRTSPIRAAGLLPGGQAVAITSAGLETFRLSFTSQRTVLPRECTAAYSAERDDLAIACQDGVWIVPGRTITADDLDALRARQPSLLAASGIPRFASFLGGGTHLAVADEDLAFSVWQLDQPKAPPASFSLTVAGEDPVALAVSGSLIAVATESGTVMTRDVSGNSPGQAIATRKALSRIAVSGDGSVLAAAGKDGSLGLWTLAGAPKWQLDTGLGEITALDFSADARTIIAAGANGAAVQVTAEGTIGQRLNGIGGSALAIAIAKTDGQLAFGTADGDIAVRQADGTIMQLPWTDHDDSVTSLTFATAGPDLVAILVDYSEAVTTVATWRAGLEVEKPGLPNLFNVARPALSATGDTLFYGRTRWNLITDQVSAFDASDAFYSPAARFVGGAIRDGSLRISSTDGTRTRELLTPREYTELVLSDAGRLAYVDRDQTLYVEQPEGRFEAKPAAGKVSSVAAAADGRWFAARRDGTLSVWNLDGTPARHALSSAPPLATKLARVAAVTPDGSHVALIDIETGIWIRGEDNTSGPIRLSPGSERQDARQVTFWRDGDAVAAIASGALFYWDVDNPTNVKKWRSGVSPWNARSMDDGLVIASLSGELYVLDRDLDMLARVVTSNDGAVAITDDSRYAGNGLLYQRTRLYTDELMPLAESDAVNHFSLERVRLTMMRQLGWWTLTRDAVVATTMIAIDSYERLPGWAKAGFWPTSLYTVLLLTMLAMWVVVPGRVAALAMPSYTEAELPAWKVVTDTLSLARWLGNTERALDGWLIATRQQQLLQGFEGKGAIQKRSVYVDLGNEDDAAAWTAAIKRNLPAHFWVTGPGGCGKSTLAFHLVRLAIETGARRPVTPVVIDSDWTGPLLEHVAEALRQGSRRPTLAMVRRLAYTGRLVLVIDGLSERRSDEARTEVLALTDTGVLRYLIVTARSEKPQRDAIRQVTVGPLDGARLETFVAAYVDESRRAAALACLTDLSNGQPIRPLFATIALDWFARDESIPDNYPALIHTYVQRLCPQGEAALREDDFLRAARLVAFASVKDGWTPRSVSREFVRGQLDAEALPFLSAAEQPAELSAAVVIDQLVQCGLVEQLASLGTYEIRFSFDPVAEYLAAMHVVMLERGTLVTRFAAPLPDTPFAEALRSIRGAAASI